MTILEPQTTSLIFVPSMVTNQRDEGLLELDETRAKGFVSTDASTSTIELYSLPYKISGIQTESNKYSFQTIQCDGQDFNMVPSMIPTSAITLSLTENLIQELRGEPFTDLRSLQVLNLTNNQINVIRVSVMSFFLNSCEFVHEISFGELSEVRLGKLSNKSAN